jgi:hypothetical protein
VDVRIDFTGLGQAIIDALIKGLQQLFSPLPYDFEVWLLHAVQSLLTANGGRNLLTHIPVEWTSQSHPVLDLYRQFLPVQLGVSALVLVIQGYRVSQGKIDIWDAVARTGFLVMVGQAIPFLADKVITLVNLASDAVGNAPLDIRNESLPNDLTIGLTLIVAAVLAVFTWLKGAVGVVFIDVLIVSGPFIISLSGLPLFEGLGKWWAEEFTTWTLRVFMVALVLRLGLGIAIENTGGLQFLFAIVSFWLAYTMDTKIRRFSVGAWGSISNAGLLAKGAKFLAARFA